MKTCSCDRAFDWVGEKNDISFKLLSELQQHSRILPRSRGLTDSKNADEEMSEHKQPYKTTRTFSKSKIFSQ